MNHQTWLEISSSAFNHNIQQLKKLAGSAQIGLVVKANAYGHGAVEIAQLAQENIAIDWLCVATLEEALTLRARGIQKPILAMASTTGLYERALQADIHCAVYDSAQLAEINEQAQRLQKHAFIHLKIDTGMARLGFTYEQLIAHLAHFKSFKNIIFYGIFSHLCDTNNPATSFTEQQITYFEKCIQTCKQAGITFTLHHLFASGMLYKQNLYDMVRIGTSAYGFWKSDIQQQRLLTKNPGLLLQPVLTWKTKLVAIANSYGYLPLGFADGYSRQLAGKTFAYINDQPCRVITVAANNIKLDLTRTSCSLGDTVTLLGNLPGISATALAENIETINNEFVTRIPPTIPRIIID